MNSFSNHFHCTILPLFLGLSLHMFSTPRDYFMRATEQELNIICINGCTSGNFWELIHFRDVIDKKILRRIGPSIDTWGTPCKLDFASDMILSIFTECVISCK